jgi:tetratricopeptide (TPR) repeat protein
MILLFGQVSAQSIKDEISTLKSYVEAENYGQALQLADKLIANKVKEDIKEHAGDVYLYRGLAKKAIGIEEDAIVDFKVAVALNNKLKDAYYYIAEVYYNLNAYSSALENVIYFLEAEADDKKGLSLKAKCLLKLGESMAAKMTIQRALALVSSDPELYYIRAAINNSLGRKDLACKDAKIALNFGFEDAQNFVDNFCNDNDE